MKVYFLIITALFTTFAITPTAFAATSEVTWTDPDSYQDIDEGEEHRDNFRESIFAHFEKHFTKMANTLPEGYVLKVNVTDIDLAGDTRAGGINRLRVIKSAYPPRMSFSYQLINAEGEKIQSDDVALKDFSFLYGRRLKYNEDPIGYEKKMLDEWFKESFDALIIPS